MDHSVTLSRSIKASSQAVYRAFTTPGGLMDWCANAVEMDVSKGRYLFLWAEQGYQLTGQIRQVSPDASVSWDIFGQETGAIKVKIKSDGEEKAQVHLSLVGDIRADGHVDFWNLALNNLQSVMETGLDRRLYDRPMLGVLIGGLLDADSQSRYRSPVPFGIIVNGTIPDMGAARVGLSENDILYEMDGAEIHDFGDLQEVVDRFKSGDSVNVKWYRYGESYSGYLSFSGRPAPFRPDSPAALADHVQSIYQRTNDELDMILSGVSEMQAEYREAENEWSIKEILAHLILTERATQFWVAAARQGQLMKSWTANEYALIQAITNDSPLLPDLVQELQRTQRQTIDLLQRLPPEIVDLKGPFMNIVTMVGEQGMPLHTRMHHDSIKALLAETQFQF